jgi:tRNA(Ile)-lysidine synthase
LLEISRSEIEAYCREQQLEPRQDYSNQDITFFRNRLRHELLPELETYNPNIRQTLQRTAKVMAAETDFLNEQLAQAWRAVVRRESPDQIELDLSSWRTLPLALKRATLRQAVQVLRHGLRDISFEHIELALNIVEKGNVGARATLPQGLMLTLGYHSFLIASAAGPDVAAPADQPQLFRNQALPLNLPGITLIPETPWQLRADFLTSEQVDFERLDQTDRWEAYLDAGVTGSELILRPRQPGDTFAPLGLAGHTQKVNDFMINKKIPAAWRNFIPLLVSAGQILWICGYSLDQGVRLHSTTKHILHLRFEQC